MARKRQTLAEWVERDFVKAAWAGKMLTQKIGGPPLDEASAARLTSHHPPGSTEPFATLIDVAERWEKAHPASWQAFLSTLKAQWRDHKRKADRSKVSKSFRISRDAEQKLERLAKQTGASLGDAIENLIKQGYESQRELAQVRREVTKALKKDLEEKNSRQQRKLAQENENLKRSLQNAEDRLEYLRGIIIETMGPARHSYPLDCATQLIDEV